MQTYSGAECCLSEAMCGDAQAWLIGYNVVMVKGWSKIKPEAYIFQDMGICQLDEGLEGNGESV